MFQLLRTSARRNVLVAATVLLAGCGGGSNLPSTYTGEFLQVREGEPGAGGEVVFGSVLEAEDGTEAEITLTFTDSPPSEGGSTECGGETYDAAQILDQSATASGTLAVQDHGDLELDVERNVGVIAEGPPGPPVCDEWSGSWSGTGELEGQSGTWELVGFHEDDNIEATLTLEEA